MNNPRYISLFSGIGGLEPTIGSPNTFCELDAISRQVLARAHPSVRVHDDVKTLKGEPADYILGGWPCQDLSIAGKMVGLLGSQSGLFYELCRIVEESGAHTAIMENVPGLFVSNGGKDFMEVVKSLRNIGLDHISWRSINSAELGIPQYRERVFIVGSRFKDRALAIHARRPVTVRRINNDQYPDVLGFYWTAGGRSLCLRKNAVPTLKVGAPSSKGGTSPIAVFYNNVVRKLTPEEAIRLQGFDEKIVAGLGYGDVLRMAGDAVSRPVGAFVVDSVFYESELGHVELDPFSVDAIPQHGYWHAGKIMAVKHNRIYQPRHIWEYLDPNCKGELSPQASAGLCCRIIRAQSIVPSALFEALYEKSKTRTKLLGTKVDSFEILHTELDAGGYLEKLRLQPEITQMDLLFDPE